MFNTSLFTLRNVAMIGLFAVAGIFIYKKISTKLTGTMSAPAQAA